MKYHLGCGSNYLPGYINVDFSDEEHTINLTVKADLYQDLRILEYEPCDEILSRHVFEHFNYVDSMFLLRQWTLSLRVNSYLIISMPDVEELSKKIASSSVETSFVIMRYLYGSHEAKWAYHINGWTPKMLKYVLGLMGHGKFEVERDISGNDINRYPNCNMTIKSSIIIKKEPDEIDRVVCSRIFPLYLNGNSKDEMRLLDLLTHQYSSLIKRDL